MNRLPFFFLACLIPVLSEARLVDKTMALVNSEVITKSDIHKLERNLGFRRELDPLLAFLGKSPKTEKELVEFLVQESLIVAKFPATKEEVNEEVQGILKRNHIDLEGLSGVLKSQGISYDNYIDLMSVSLSKRKLMERELRPLSVVTEDEVKNYYYTAPEFLQRKQKQSLLLSYGLVQMQIPSRALADEVKERLKSGEDFDAVANQLSERGVRVADLGVIREDKVSDAIRKSLDGLKVGEYTAPLNLSGSDYLIHKIASISAPHDPIFEAEKAKIQNTLYQRAMDRQLNLWTERERRSAYIHIPE